MYFLIGVIVISLIILLVLWERVVNIE
jgi:hypothetical protein